MTKQLLHRDGTSQAGRIQKALDPQYIRVDERSIRDLLDFASKYAKELRYFNAHNQADGDWSDFLRENALDQIMAYLSDPDSFLREAKNRDAFIPRPHLILFITFLQLLQHARVQLNELTRRHLEFYYREALRLTSQPGEPDHVHVLVELANGQDQFLVPAGTLLQAGQDSQGNDLFYRSDEELVANQASVASVKSLLVEKKVIGIREAQRAPDVLIDLFPETNAVLEEEGKLSERSFMAMLMMALGTPSPGGTLEPYPGKRTVNASLLAELDGLLDFIPTQLHMSLATFRLLMQLKNDLLLGQDQEKPINQQWQQINDKVEEAGKRRDPQFTLDRSEPDNFEKNLLSALGRPEFGDFFNELPDIDNIYDLYRNQGRDDVRAFIGESGEDGSVKIGPALYMSVKDFDQMLRSVEEINRRWRQVYEILRAAHRKKDPAYVFASPQIRTYEPDKFHSFVEKTLGKDIAYPVFNGAKLANFDDCYAQLINLESYFHMPAEKFAYIRKINAMAKEPGVQPWEWDQVYAILQAAHTEQIVTARRNQLQETNESASGGFEAMIRFALGDPAPGDALPTYAKNFLDLDAVTDKDYLQEKLFLAPENFSYIKDHRGLQRNDAKWQNIYAILEQAQRRKRQWEAPRAEIEQWENVYVAEDARQVQVRVGAEGESNSPRWRTFGEGYQPQQGGPVRTLPGNIGFAIASPLLMLAEGTRIITLTLAFHEDGFDKPVIDNALKGPSPFRLMLSTENGMIAIEQVKIESIVIPPPAANTKQICQLQFTLTLDPQVPPITGLATGNGINLSLPQLHILLADNQERERAPSVKSYRAFQSLKVERVHLQVKVDGITDLVLQNDDGMLDAQKPFTPFGGSPVVGSSFYFAHAELCAKRLDELRLHMNWLGAPDQFSTYYLGYLKSEERGTDPTRNLATSPIADNATFKARLKLFDNRSFFDVQDLQLFTGPITVSYSSSQSNPQLITAQDVLTWNRYWQLELLAPDFQHAIYPRVAAACVNKATPYIVNSPYTPRIKRLSVGYTANTEVDELYHIHPFGYRSFTRGEEKTHPFLPRYENEGELFIGIKDLLPPQNLSLLFQMAEGSGDPDVEREPVHWSYLSGNAWHSLEQGQLLGDTTHGLRNSGIIKFNLTSVEPSTLLPTGLYWIRAAMAKNSRSVADTVAIKAQAVSATFVDQGNAPDHLSHPLPAESIRGLAESLPQVRAIQQPYSSFGGKSPEQAGRFYTRVSERLRHKDRALTSWDYEHLVLEAFPGIYKVKCLPVGSADDPSLSDVVQVVVIPDIRGKLPFDPFEPKAPADVLSQIEQYLWKHNPPHCQLKVKNPTYVRIRVRLSVRFRQGYAPGYYQDLLNRELQQYLAPWAYDQSADIFFGGAINTSLIINFVEKRPYLDYVAGIKIFTSVNGKEFTLYEPKAGETPALFALDAILVSDRSHVIDLITEEGFDEEFYTGINAMKIELDFQVS